jgi:AraC family cel operon transcriptional repressor
MQAKFLSQKKHIDEDTGCRYRYIFSESERFLLHGHDFYEIFITVNKKIVHMVNGEKQHLAVGSMVFVRPDDIHSYEYEPGNQYNFVNLAFDKKTMNDIIKYIDGCFNIRSLLESKLPPVVILSPTEKKNLLSRLSELNYINRSDRNRLKLQLRLLLLDIFVRYFSNNQISTSENVPYWFENMCEQMRKLSNFSEGIGQMEKICRKSREHIARCMRKYKGITPTEFINDIRLNYIANMLLNSNVPILDLCFESGFKNVGWFYTLFKDKYGASPAKFRNQYRHKRVELHMP